MAFDRLRFDFNYGYALTDTQLEEIERLINGWIEAATFFSNKWREASSKQSKLFCLVLYPQSKEEIPKEVNSPQPPSFLEVVCQSSGKKSRFAAGTKAGFAVFLTNIRDRALLKKRSGLLPTQ